MPEQAKRGLRALLSVAAAGLALWIALRFLLPWLGPFLLALALASLLEPGVRALIRHGWRRGLAAALLTLLLLGLLFWGLAELGGRCLSAAASLTRELPRLMQAMAQTAAGLEERLLRLTASAPEELRDYLDLALQSFGEALGALPLQLSQRLLGALSRLAQSGPDLLLFTVTAGLGTYFLSASYPKSMAFLRAQLPDALAHRLRELRADLRGSFGGLLRTQLLLMGLCFLANATVFLPAPSLLIAASCALIMDPLLVALCAAFGSALGEMVGYLLGRTGQDLSPRFRDLAEKLRSRVKNELLLVFILALLPLPLFDFAGVWCGGTRQHPVRFFLVCFAGKFLKMLVYTRLYDILAWAGEAYGLDLSELIP